jgi:hypothetical protein
MTPNEDVGEWARDSDNKKSHKSPEAGKHILTSRNKEKFLNNFFATRRVEVMTKTEAMTAFGSSSRGGKSLCEPAAPKPRAKAGRVHKVNGWLTIELAPWSSSNFGI